MMQEVVVACLNTVTFEGKTQQEIQCSWYPAEGSNPELTRRNAA